MDENTIKNIVNFGGSGSGSSGGNVADYSTTEKKIGTWVDGSDVYAKCFTTAELENLGEISLIRGTPFCNFEKQLVGTAVNPYYLPGVFDGKKGLNEGYGLYPPNINPTWVGLENCSPFIFDHAIIYFDVLRSSPPTCYIQGFDGDTWETVSSVGPNSTEDRNKQSSGYVGKVYYYNVSTSNKVYSAIRFYAAGALGVNNSSASNYSMIREIEFYGKKFAVDIIDQRLKKDYTYMEYIKLSGV